MIEDIKAREKEATPGPWENDGLNRWWVVAPRCPKHGVIADCGPTSKLHRERGPNADFIAHAREDIPYLLAQLKDREEKLEAVGRAAHSGQYVWRHELDRILKGGE